MKKERIKRVFLVFLSALIVAIETGIFTYTWFTSYEHIGSNYFVRGNIIVIGLYALFVFFFYNIYGGFKISQLRTFEMLCSQIISIVFANGITYLQLSLIGRWEFLSNLRPMVNMTLVQIGVIIVFVLFTRWFYIKFFPPRDILVIYGKYSPDNIIRKFSTRSDKYNIQETISIDEDIEVIKEKILEFNNVMLADIPAELRNIFLKYCFANNIRCYMVPKLSDIMIRATKEINLFDTAVLLARNKGLNLEQQIVKRAFDIICSIIAIIISSPLMLIFAILIKAYDGGPVIFKQDRLTINGKIFEVYKFRSMRVEKENDEHHLTRKDDDRITPVGKFLRTCHLDELPQLFNILKGDMSFVGPRPECPEIAKQYTQIVPEFDFRLKVKGGLTGFAQVYGKYNTTPYDKLKLDLEYIENYSIFLDLKLMMLTFKILFNKENTEGIEDWQITAATQENLDNLENSNIK